MKISTKGRYALEAVVDMVYHAGDAYESIRSIAERRNISENYLEQIYLVLRKTGLVESTRGPQGGYRLAKAPENVTACDVLCALEGKLLPVQCLDPDAEESCPREEYCATHQVWQRIATEMHDIIHGVTIADLVNCTRRRMQYPNMDYVI